MSKFTNLEDLRAILSGLVTGWPIRANFDGRSRREVTVTAIRKVQPKVIEITGALDARDIVMLANLDEQSPSYGSGEWRYTDEGTQENYL